MLYCDPNFEEFAAQIEIYHLDKYLDAGIWHQTNLNENQPKCVKEQLVFGTSWICCFGNTINSWNFLTNKQIAETKKKREKISEKKNQKRKN